MKQVTERPESSSEGRSAESAAGAGPLPAGAQTGNGRTAGPGTAPAAMGSETPRPSVGTPPVFEIENLNVR